MHAILVSAALIFIAEFADKSQLMAMSFATRYRARVVIAGVAVASAVLNGLSSILGNFIGDRFPTDAVRIGSGVLFLVFAALALIPHRDDDGEPRLRSRGASIVVVALAFGVAELGDKTMLETMALATRFEWPYIWIGSTIGMIASASLAVYAGKTVLKRVPDAAIRYVSAGSFALVGLLFLLA